MRFTPTAQIAPDDTAAIASVTRVERMVKTAAGEEEITVRQQTVKMHDKVKALVKIGEHVGLWAKGGPVEEDMPIKLYLKEDWERI